MKIAVATEEFARIAGHAGQARDWVVFEALEGQPTREVYRIRLQPHEVFHRHKGGAHPLDDVQAMIAASAGDGFLNRMRKRGVQAMLTAEEDVAAAVSAFLAGRLRAPNPPGFRGLVCKLRDRFSPHRG